MSYQPPYVARLKDSSDEEPKVEVFHVDSEVETKIGEYEVSNFKNPEVCFYPFKQNSKWYALTSFYNTIKVYSLPDMEVVAKEEDNSYSIKIGGFYIPRFWHSSYYHKNASPPFTSYHTFSDSLINMVSDGYIPEEHELDPDWNHADFAFVLYYDPYSTIDNLVALVDLSKISEGKVFRKSDEFVEIPGWMNLDRAIDVTTWRKDFPIYSIAQVRHFSSETGKDL